MPSDISQLLSLANGNRRVRTLDIRDIQRVLSRLPRRPGAFFTDSGGYVPGIYNYRSRTTVCLAVRRSDGRIALAIGTTGARYGHIQRPTWLASQIPVLAPNAFETILLWADSARDLLREDGGVLVLGISR